MARITGRIDSWFKGMSEDVRIQDFSHFFLSIHNDLFSSPKRVTPFRNTEDNTTDGNNYRISRFLYINSKLYGLGSVDSSTDVTKIYEKSGDVITSGWTPSANGQSASGARSSRCFIYYKGYFYGFAEGSDRIWAYDIAGGAGAFKETALSVSWTSPAQAIVTSDDLLLVPYDNFIAVKDGGSSYNDNWESARLTLPSDYVIVDLEEHGSLVAITCRPLNTQQFTSKVFLWDKVSPDLTETIDVGEGDAILSASLSGELLTVVNSGGGSSVSIKNDLVLRRYIGGRTSEVLMKVPTQSAIVSTQAITTKIKESNICSFLLSTNVDGTSRLNMWSIGKIKSGYPFMLTMGQEVNNNTQPNSVYGAFKLGGYTFFGWINNNGDSKVSRTNNDNTYTATSTVITQKINGESEFKGASKYRKQLLSCGITCPPLPSGGTISLYHRVDSTSTWKKVFDYTTANGMVREAGVYDDDSDFLIGYEHQFKVETTGGTALPAEWLSIDYEMEILDADIS